ncbi:MAG: hypothetical protein R3C68_10815 [Myxococcota bacterium]
MSDSGITGLNARRDISVGFGLIERPQSLRAERPLELFQTDMYVGSGASPLFGKSLDPWRLAAVRPIGQALSLTPQDIYIWFDIGNVLVDLRDNDGIRMMPGALDYLRELRQRGYKIGAITNFRDDKVPRDLDAQIDALQRVIDTEWIDPGPPFVLRDAFESIYLPITPEEDKPSPVLFRKALALANSHQRQSLYVGETPEEVERATGEGMAAFQIEYDGPRALYLPANKIPKFVEDNIGGG